MTHLDLFSGYGGFSIAMERCGFHTLAFAEIEPFACRVLAHHWPMVPNLGDVAKIDGCEFAGVDVVTFGSPCQDLSVAGLRGGLSAERSGLFHEAIRIIRDVRPAFAVWENVVGALSSQQGRDFGTVLDALAELGAVDIAWRVLDAQFFGVPQRRRRIFVVADFRAERAEQILFELEGVRGDSAPRRAARKDIAPSLTTGSGGGRYDKQPHVAHALRARSNASHREDSDTYIPFDLAQVTSPTNRNRVEPGLPAPSLATTGAMHVAAINLRGRDGGSQAELSDVASLRSSSGGSSRSYVTHVAPCLTRTYGTGPMLIADPLTANEQRSYSHAGNNPRPRNVVACSLIDTLQLQGHDLAHGNTNQADSDQVLRLLREAIGTEAFQEWGIGVVAAFRQAQILRPTLYGSCLRREAEQVQAVVHRALSCTEADPAWIVRSVRKAKSERCSSSRWEPSEQLTWELGAYLSRLSQRGASQRDCLHNLWRAAEGLRLLREALSAVQEMGRSEQAGWPKKEEVPDVRVDGARKGALRSSLHAIKAGQAPIGVRRLLPIECERLQGLPDHWTDISGASDSARYRCLGNGVAVPVVEWIARRMAAAMSEREAA